MVIKAAQKKTSLKEEWDFIVVMFYLLLLLAMPIALCIYAYDAWMVKHTTFPYTGSGRYADTPRRSKAFAYAAEYLRQHKVDVMGPDLYYSDAPFWERPCSHGDYPVRVLGSILDPATASTSDVTMYFCYVGKGVVYPQNQTAQFYTRGK